MKHFVFFLFMASSYTIGVDCDKKTEFHFIRTEKMNETDDLFKYDLQKVEKQDSSVFMVDCESDLLVDLDNEWHMWLNVYHNAAGEEDFGEKPILALPKKAFCDFMQSTYKDKLYSSIKDYSNLPNPDDCPVKANHFVIKDYPFNASKYSAIAKPGLWRIDLFLSQDHEDSHVTKIGVSIFTSVTQEES